MQHLATATRVSLVLCFALLANLAPADPPPCGVFTGTMLPATVTPWPDDLYPPSIAVVTDNDLAVFGTYTGLDIFDLSDPTEPQYITSIVDEDLSWPSDLACDGNLVYVAGGASSSIIDLSDPAAPVTIGTLPGTVWSLDAADGLLVVRDGTGIVLYTMADPLSPGVASTLDLNGKPFLLGDDRLMITRGGFDIVDISDPTAPVVLNSLDYPTESGYQYQAATGVASAILLDGDLLVRTEYQQIYGNYPYGDWTSNVTYQRRLYDLAAPGEPVEINSAAVGATGGYLVTTEVRPMLRVGDLVIDRRDVVAPDNVAAPGGPLAAIAMLPVPTPLTGGLVLTTAGDVLILGAEQSAIVSGEALALPNIIQPQLGPVVAQFYEGGGAGDQLLAATGCTENYPGDCPFRVRVCFEPGGAVETLASGLWWIGGPWISGPNLMVQEEAHFAHYVVNGPGDAHPGGLVVLGFVESVLVGPEPLVAPVVNDVARIHDLADPAAPVARGLFDLTTAGVGDLHGARWEENHLLVYGSDGLALVDMDDLDLPTVAGTFGSIDIDWAVEAGPGQVIVAATDELVRLDVSDPAAITVAVTAPRELVDGPIVVSGDFAYALAGDVLSLVDLETLEPLGAMVLTREVEDMALWQGVPIVSGRDGMWGYAAAACEAVVTATGDDLPAPLARLLAQPNPFNPQTSLVFTMARQGRAELDIYDSLGRAVRRLDLGILAAGPHQVRWDGRADDGRGLPSGVYLCRLATADGAATTKAVLVR